MTSENKVTIASVRETLDKTGTKCPVALCGSESFDVEAVLGNNEMPSMEYFTCRACNTKWSVFLYAAQIEEITFPENDAFPFGDRRIEDGALEQMAFPASVLATALQGFILEMKRGSIHGKAKALANLASIARVDLTQLPGSSLEERPELLSEGS